MACYQPRYLEPDDKVNVRIWQGGQSTYVLLDARHLYDTLIDSTSSDETIHCDLTSLTKPMCAVHGLRVVGRVPVALVEDDGIGGGEINSEPSRSRTQ
jgi:hypothetical protein